MPVDATGSMNGFEEFAYARAALSEWRITPLAIVKGVLPQGPAGIDGPGEQEIFGVSAIVRYATYHRQGNALEAVVKCTNDKVTLIARILADGWNVQVEEAVDAAE